MRSKSALVILAVSLVMSAHAFDGIKFRDHRVFVEQPGNLEFTGTMIARPIQSKERGVALKMVAKETLRTAKATDELILQVPSGSNENAYSQLLMATGLFEYVVPNWKCYPLRTPNDGLFGQQWHHTQIRSDLAWNLNTGSNTMTVAMTDTGVDASHPDLSARLIPGYNAVDRIAQVNGGDVSDLHGHGTHVAGCMGASGNNGLGVSGVGWSYRIMPIRVSNSTGGGAYYEDLLDGARWAAEHGAKVVSASYSGVDYEPIQTTGAYIRSIGSLYLYAAGNDSRDLSWFDWNDVIVVGASTYGDDRAWFSAYGTAVDVFSPGVDILSTVVGGGYQAWSGTSMATPVANGLCALIWSANPLLTPAQVETILTRTCKDLGPAGNDAPWGWGRIDAYRAVKMASPHRIN